MKANPRSVSGVACGFILFFCLSVAGTLLVISMEAGGTTELLLAGAILVMGFLACSVIILLGSRGHSETPERRPVASHRSESGKGETATSMVDLGGKLSLSALIWLLAIGLGIAWLIPSIYGSTAMLHSGWLVIAGIAAGATLLVWLGD